MRKDEKLIGAALERKAILRKVRRMLTEVAADARADDILPMLGAWLLDRDKRYGARKGGLGK